MEANGRQLRIPKPVVHFLHIRCGNGTDFLISKVRLDVVVGDPAVTIQRTFSHSEPHTLIQPLVQPLAKGEVGVFYQLHIPESFDAPVEFSINSFCVFANTLQ